MHNNMITDKGINNLTNLTTLWIGPNKNVTNECINKFTNLTALNIDYEELVTNEDFKCLIHAEIKLWSS